jgi:hypothetical protein
MRNIQLIGFPEEYSALLQNSRINKSKLNNLTPIFDHHDKLIRVGGRLENSLLSYSEKHPMIVPKDHPFIATLIKHYHLKSLHAGPQALMNILRQKYWILNGKGLIRKIVHDCIRCFRTRPVLIQQIMGNLPAQRVQPARPFANSGVDFCGPIRIHHKIRGKRPDKGYIAVFVCFATKAVHLEAVPDLTSNAFIRALRRFTGRRGSCKNLWCDNATNFVGGNRELEELRHRFESQEHRDLVIQTCADDRINFHFISARAQHFGGLWEAAVKSAKHHLYRMLSEASLTYEELETLVIEVESILNSRPLTLMSTNPEDIEVLTPGHFLIGEPLVSIVEPRYPTENLGCLTNYQRIRALHQHFWKRWSNEYLAELQKRNNWTSSAPNVTIGTIVLIAGDNLPPQKWLLGRIAAVHPASDGHVRAATVKTKNGTLKRPIIKLAPLPMEQPKI